MSKKKPITDEDFSAWKDNPVTMAVIDYLRERTEYANRVWVGVLKGDLANERDLLLLKVELKAKVELIEDFIGLQLEDIQDNDASLPTSPIKLASRRINAARAN